MADAVWPVSLPQEPRLKEYSETPPDLTLRTAVSSGPAKVRRRNGANVRVARFAFDMTQAQWETFDAFFMETIAAGALPFELTRPSTGNVADWRIVGLPDYTPLSPRGGRWVVRFEAEMLPGTEQEEGGDPDPPDPEDALSMLGGDGYEGVEEELAAGGASADLDGYGYTAAEYALFGAAPPAQEDFHMLQPQDYGLEADARAGEELAEEYAAASQLGDSVTESVYGGAEDAGYGGGYGVGGVGGGIT